MPEFTKGQRMRYQLLYHKAMNKAFIPFTSDSIMQEVADYYEHHGSANNQMLAYYVLGCVYRDMHEAPTALEYYNKATEQADTTATAEANTFKTTHATILGKTTETVTSSDLPAITAALTAYEELSDAAKAKLVDGEKSLHHCR